MYLIVQCVVYRAYEDMLLVKASGDVFSVAPGFPDKNTLPVRKNPKKTVGTWSSKFCRLNNTNSSLVPFIKKFTTLAERSCRVTCTTCEHGISLERNSWLLKIQRSFIFVSCHEHHSLSCCLTPV